MDELANVTMLESMAISDNDELITAGGETGVDLTDSDVTKAAGSVSSVDKENEGDQRAGAAARSAAVGAVFFGMPPRNPASEGDTHSLSGSTDSPAAAAVGMACQLTAHSVATRAAELFPGGSAVPAVKPRQPPVVEKASFGLASHVFACALRLPAAPAPLELRQLGIHVRRAAPHATPSGGDGGQLLGRQEGAQFPPTLELCPIHLIYGPAHAWCACGPVRCAQVRL